MESGSLEGVLEFLRGGVDVDGRVEEDGSRPLMVAVRLQQEEIVSELAQPAWGEEIVSELAQPAWGVDIAATDYKGRTALHLAALHEGEVAMRGVDIAATDYKGRTALHLAALHEGEVAMRVTTLPQVLETLLDRNPNADAADLKGYTSLHNAAQFAGLPEVSILVQRGGADVSAETKQSQTPLHLACYKPRAKVVEYLLARLGEAANFIEGSNAAKNAVNRTDWRGDTPLHLLATDDANLASMSLLLRAGAATWRG
ncbi:ankyrin repeat-containing domain protein [Baffinella frigidus]|nr:ankyrin repeat-containing domain protein [Cryptophyta sp. CCMP2293]